MKNKLDFALLAVTHRSDLSLPPIGWTVSRVVFLDIRITSNHVFRSTVWTTLMRNGVTKGYIFILNPLHQQILGIVRFHGQMYLPFGVSSSVRKGSSTADFSCDHVMDDLLCNGVFGVLQTVVWYF